METRVRKTAANQFKTAVYPGEVYKLSVGLPGRQNRGTGEYYVKEVLQNNLPMLDPRVFQVFGGNLRIVLSKHPASFQAQIEIDPAKPQPLMRVILFKEG